MKVPYDEGVANHIGPESCVYNRKVADEALTGESTGQVLSRVSSNFEVSTMSNQLEDNTGHTDIARHVLASRGIRPCARTEASRTGTGRSHACPRQMAPRTALRIPREHDSDERAWEVGQVHMCVPGSTRIRWVKVPLDPRPRVDIQMWG
jgi:hypothetical protein